MDENPYESPKEVSSPPTVKAGVGLGMLLLLSIPAGCVCGGISCWTSGVVGEVTVEKHGPVDAGFVIGIPIGLIVTVLIPVLAVRFFGKQKNGGIMRQSARKDLARYPPPARAGGSQAAGFLRDVQ